MRPIEVFPIPGIPEVKEGSDLAALVYRAMRKGGLSLKEGDIVVVKQKVVSKSEGRLVRLSEVVPSARARRLAKEQGKDERLVEVILREATEVVRKGHGVIITRTRHGYVCANSGVDQSNVGEGMVALLPLDPDASAKALRTRLESLAGTNVAVVVSDTFGRPWRLGQTDVAIGCSGIVPLLGYAGKKDRYGYELRVTELSVVDEAAGAAELAVGKLEGIPAAVVRGVKYVRGDSPLKATVMPKERDLFR